MWQLLFAMLFHMHVFAVNPKVDPIRFTMTTTATHITLGEEFEIKITASYQQISPNLVYVFQGANSFKLKMVFPDGFKQTGGSYYDYIGADLSSSKPSVSYTVKGKFTEGTGDGSFLLLRGNKNAGNDSDFILVGRVGFSAFRPGNSTPEEQLARLAVVSQEYMPFMTVAEFRAGEADTTSVIYIKQGKKSGVFIRDDAATGTSDDNGALTLFNGTKLYKRKHDNIFYPEWWGATGDGVTNDAAAIQAAAAAAGGAKAELQFNARYVVASTEILLKSSVGGYGTILTRLGATLRAAEHNITVKNITIDGLLSGAPSGNGMTADGVTGITFENLKVSNVAGQGFWCRNTDFIKISGCTVKTVRGSYGDGIYVSQAVSPQIVNNHCSDFSRIGITCEGSTAKPTSNAIVIGNSCLDASESMKPDSFPNAGIWAENIAGIIIEGNTVNNSYARGIVVTPSIDNLTQYQYIISNNKVFNVQNSGPHVGVGIALSYGQNQVATISGNIITDCKKGIDAGWAQLVNIIGNTFNRRNQTPDWFVSNIFLIPSVNDWTANYVISNCVNNINSTTTLPVGVADVFGQKANITINDCVGNFAFVNQSRTTAGDIMVSNTRMDWSSITTTGNNCISNVSGRAFYDNCDLKLPINVQLTAAANEFNVANSRVIADSATRILIYKWGAKIIRISNSSFQNVRFYNLQREANDSEIYLTNSSFEGYDVTQGLFEACNHVIPRLEVFGCTFSRTIAATPIQFPAGVTNSYIGHNTYFTTALYSGFTPGRQSISLSRGSTAQRPVITQLGYLYFDTDLSREVYWDGSEWVLLTTPASFVTNAAAAAPSKATLNGLYGSLKAGSVATYQSISGGAREYRKLTDTASSDWVQTIWSTGIKSIVP